MTCQFSALNLQSGPCFNVLEIPTYGIRNRAVLHLSLCIIAYPFLFGSTWVKKLFSSPITEANLLLTALKYGGIFRMSFWDTQYVLCVDSMYVLEA